MNLIKAVATVGGWTAVSRLLGMVREILMSHFLGVSIVSDAFVVAFKFPNFFRRFFAEGAFNAAFVPQFAGKLADEGLTEAKRLSNDVFTLMTWFLVGFVLIVEIFTPFLIPLIAPGFTDSPERLILAITFTRITFPYILFISLTALLGGMLTSLERFWVTAAAPVLLNVVMIAALLATPRLQMEPGHVLSAAVLIAGVVQLGFLYVACRHYDIAPRLLLPKLTPEAIRVMKLMLPGMVGAGVMQINMLIDLQLASLLPVGSMSYLYYADRLYQLPMSVFGVAIGTALLPSLSKLWRANNRAEALALQNKSLLFVLFMNMPAAVGLIVLSQPLIALLFGHGAFSAADVAQTAPTLAAYAIGLPAYVVTKVFTTTFFAQSDTKTPVKVGMYVIGANLVLNLILMSFLAHVGLALATSISAYLQVVIVGVILNRRGLFTLSKELMEFAAKIIALSLIMGVIVHAVIPRILSRLYTLSFLASFEKYSSVLFILVATGVGVVFYMSTSYFAGALRLIRR